MTSSSSFVLSLLCGLPLFGALVVLFAPRQKIRFTRGFTIGVMLVVFLLSLILLTGDYTTGTLLFGERHVLVPAYGITYSVGVDGLSLWLILLTTFITP
ncbi:MAG: NADH-quinone oxidoreductase subunit M, partial [Polyangiales bacterium]